MSVVEQYGFGYGLLLGRPLAMIAIIHGFRMVISASILGALLSGGFMAGQMAMSVAAQQVVNSTPAITAPPNTPQATPNIVASYQPVPTPTLVSQPLW